MLRGLDGRRVGVFGSSNDAGRTAIVNQALEQAGARVHVLSGANASDEDFHGAKYAALVLVGDEDGRFEQDPRVVQLAREFLASDKPVAAFGGALNVILEAGGVAGRTLAAHAPLRAVLECLGFALMCPTKPPRPDRRAPSGQATIVEFHSNDGPRFAKQGSDAIIKLK